MRTLRGWFYRGRHRGRYVPKQDWHPAGTPLVRFWRGSELSGEMALRSIRVIEEPELPYKPPAVSHV